MKKEPLIQFTDRGLYCRQANVYIDPWKAVDNAIVTHAHSDHAYRGHGLYVAHAHTNIINKARLGQDIRTQDVSYGEVLHVNGVKISLHPAGHLIGSAQVRLEYQDEIWVISGDYKLNDDGFAQPFEPVKCHHFVTESTFGLPIFQWAPPQLIYDEVNEWWADNASQDTASVLFCYSLGKAQRLLKHLNLSIGKVFVHGSIWNLNETYLANGIELPEVLQPKEQKDEAYKHALILTPSSALNTPWLRKFEPYVTASASGWMNLRGARRWQALDRGFVLSDHADWKELNTAVKETGAEHIYVTHGYTEVFTKWLCEKGYDARVVKTHYTGEQAAEKEEIAET